MSPRHLRIALFSLFSILTLAVYLPAQFSDDLAFPGEKLAPVANPKPTLPSTFAPEVAPQPDAPLPPIATVKTPRHIPHVIPRTVYVTEMRPLSKEEEQELTNYEQLVKSLREAKDDAARLPIADKIKAILLAKFDRDMAQRNKELKVVEERVATLRKQHDKRASMKDEIISLNMKNILFNADGLDLPFGLPPSTDTSPAAIDPNYYSAPTAGAPRTSMMRRRKDEQDPIKKPELRPKAAESDPKTLEMPLAPIKH